MSCDRWIELLVDRSVNELDEEDTILLEQHLAECPECRSEELRLRRILAPEVPRSAYRPTPDMDRRVWKMRQLEIDSDAPSRTRRPFRWLHPFTRPVPVYWAATAAVIAVLAGLWVGQRGAHSSQGTRTLPLSPPERFTPIENSRAPLAFATTPGDAISLPLATPRDTL